MNYTKKAVKGAGEIFFISLIAAFLAYLLRILLAAKLSTTEFGLFYAALSFITLINFFKDFGLSQSLLHLVPKFLVHKKYDSIKFSILFIFFVQFLLSIILLTPVVIFSGWLAQNYFHDQQAQFVLIILSVLFMLRPIVFLLSKIFHSFQRMRLFISIDFLRTAFILMLCLLGFGLFGSVRVPALAYLVASIILIILFTPIFFRTFPQFKKVKARYDPRLAKELFRLGVPLMLVTGSWLILGNSDSVMLTYFYHLDQVAFYNVALAISSLLGYFSLSFMYVILPMSSELWAKNHKDRLMEGIQILHKYSFVILIPAILIVVSFPSAIIGIFFPSDYSVAANALRILVLSTIPLTILRINLGVLSGIGKPKQSLKIVIAGAVLNILLNLLLIPLLGIVGAALTTFLGFLVMMVLSIFILRAFVRIKSSLRAWILNLLVGFITLGVIQYLLTLIKAAIWIKLISVSLIAMAIYLALLFSFKIVTIAEIKNLSNRVINKPI